MQLEDGFTKKKPKHVADLIIFCIIKVVSHWKLEHISLISVYLLPVKESARPAQSMVIILSISFPNCECRNFSARHGNHLLNEQATFYRDTINSFRRHVQNVTIPCHSQELLPFLSVMYFSLPPFSTNHLSILSHLILPSVSWSTSQSCCSQTHI